MATPIADTNELRERLQEIFAPDLPEDRSAIDRLVLRNR